MKLTSFRKDCKRKMAVRMSKLKDDTTNRKQRDIRDFREWCCQS